MKNPFEFADRLFRYITNRSGEEEKQAMEQLFAQDDEFRRLADEFRDRKRVRETVHLWRQFDPERALKRIDLHRRRTRRKFLFRWGAAAAVTLILAGWWMWDTRKPIADGPGANVAMLADSSKFVILETASGKSFRLDTLGNLSLRQEQSNLSNQKGMLAWSSAETDELQTEVKYNKIIVPYTQTYRLLLPDGSHIHLNSGSTLEFPSRFAQHERRVRIRGEAYCEVSHHSSWPFVVETGTVSVKVLGTVFNVKAYPDEEEVFTTLVDGSVSVSAPSGSPTCLRPGQLAVYSSETQSLQVSQADVEAQTAWKDGLFCFRNQSLKEILRVLARWYDLRVSYTAPELQTAVFNGKIPMYSSVEDVLRKFEYADRVHFELQGKNLIVRKK